MSNDKRNEFAGEIITPEIARKQIIEIGRVNRVPPEVGIFDSPTRCFIVNVEWWAHIAGMVHWLADVASWQDAEDESYFAIQEILKFMQGMECMEFQLRQNPEDSCILQQTLDGGETWSDVFDFSLCTVINNDTSQTTITNNYFNAANHFQENIYNNYVNNYVNSVTDIHPELGYGDSDDGFRNDGLCYTLKQLIDSLCGAALEILAAVDETGNDLRAALAIVGAVLGILILAGTGVGLPAATILSASLVAGGIGLGAALAPAILDALSGLSQAVFENEAAKEELQCALFELLKDANVDHADIIAAFAAVSGLSSDAMSIAQFGNVLVGELAYYSAFTENLAINFQSAKLDLLPPCPCSESGWCYVSDFTLSDDGWVTLAAPSDYGVYQADGWHSEFENFDERCYIRWLNPAGETDCNYVVVRFRADGTSSSSSRAIELDLRNNGVSQFSFSAGNYLLNTDNEIEFGGFGVTWDEVRVIITGAQPVDGLLDIKVTEVEMRGDSDSPRGVSNCP